MRERGLVHKYNQNNCDTEMTPTGRHGLQPQRPNKFQTDSSFSLAKLSFYFTFHRKLRTHLDFQHGAVLDVVMMKWHRELEFSRFEQESESFSFPVHVVLFVHL